MAGAPVALYRDLGVAQRRRGRSQKVSQHGEDLPAILDAHRREVLHVGCHILNAAVRNSLLGYCNKNIRGRPQGEPRASTALPPGILPKGPVSTPHGKKPCPSDLAPFPGRPQVGRKIIEI